MTNRNFNYTNEELEIIDFLQKKVIQQSSDPECPIEIYKSDSDKTEFPILSFTLDQYLSHPKWFNIKFLKKSIRIEIQLNKADIHNNWIIHEVMKRVDYSYPVNDHFSCQIECGTDHNSLIKTMDTILPVLKYRFHFLYIHRLVDPVGCELLNECSRQKRCCQSNREMYIRCSYRKLLGHLYLEKTEERINEIMTEDTYENKKREKGKLIRNLPDDFTIVDIETTGLSADYDEIIEYGAIRIRNGQETARFSTLVNSKVGIYDPYVTELTGITNEMLRDAPSIDEATKEFIEFIGDDIVGGHRFAFFDVNFIYDAVKESTGKDFSNDYLDTWSIANRIFGKSLKNLKLETLAAHFGVDYSNAHRAIGDCEITLECYKQLKQMVFEKYGSEEEYIRTFRKKTSKERIRDLVVDESMKDEDSIIFGKEVCITGELNKMKKKAAYQMIINIGGIPNDDRVSKNCSFLVISDDMYKQIANGRTPTTKIRTAKRNRMKGQDIEILSESTLYEIIGV